MIDGINILDEPVQQKEIVLTEELKILFDPDGIPTRYVLITGGRGGQKSFGSATFLCNETFYPDVRALYLRHFLVSAADSIIPEFQEKIETLGYTENFRCTQRNVVNLETGSEVLFRGINNSVGNQTAKLKGMKNITIMVLDEAEETVDPTDFDKIDHGIRSDQHRNIVFVIMNPADVDHWVYKRWIKDTHRIEMIDGAEIPISTHEDVTHIHLTYLDNLSNLSDSYVNDVILKLKKNNLKLYQKIFLGTWDDVRTGNEIYPGFSRDQNTGVVPYLPGLPIHISFDQNVHPYITAKLWQVKYHGPNDQFIQLRNFMEYCLKDPDNTTRRLCQRILKDQGDRLKDFKYYGDASGSSADTRGKLDDYAIVEQVFRDYVDYDSKQVFRANPNVKKRCEFISDIMAGNVPPECPEMEDIEIIIDAKNCPNTVIDYVKTKKDINGTKLKQVVTKKKDGDVKSKLTYQLYGHTSDADDYFIIKVLSWIWDRYRGKKRHGVRTNQ